MADRSVAKPGEDPEDTREIVELDKDERWQSRLEEARARREIALREKANQPPKKRKKPWEEDDEDDDFTIEPIIQEKPADEPDLDFADRLEVMREAPKEDPAPEIEAAPPPPPSEPAPKARSKPTIKRASPPPPPRVRDFDEIIPPEVTPIAGRPAPPPKPRRDRSLVPDDAPNVYDLAQRYAATLKPPRNITQPFDTIYSEPTPEPDPIPAPPPPYTGPRLDHRSRRPIGLGLVVLAFSMIPLAQMAPPLEKGPEEPPTPFFGLPPALGLNTSLVWRPESYPSAPAMPVPPNPALGTAPAFDAPPADGAATGLRRAPDFAALGLPVETGAIAWSGVDAPVRAGPVGAMMPGDAVDGALPLPPMQSPRPQPKSRALTAEPEIPPGDAPEAGAAVQTGTAVDAAPSDLKPGALGAPSRDAAPELQKTTPELKPTSLNVTILVPDGADPAAAEAIARDAQAQGHSLARIRPVNVSISEPNVRFFHNDDRPAATRLARSYGVEVKDFTWFRPSPEKGTTEIWLSGSAGRKDDALPPEASEQAPEVLVIRRKPTLLERFLTGSGADIEIVLPNPNGVLGGGDAVGN